MEDRGDLLESGVFDGHLYGTPKPPEDPDDGPISNIIGTPAREKPQIVPPNKLAPNMVLIRILNIRTMFVDRYNSDHSLGLFTRTSSFEETS